MLEQSEVKHSGFKNLILKEDFQVALDKGIVGLAYKNTDGETLYSFITQNKEFVEYFMGEDFLVDYYEEDEDYEQEYAEEIDLGNNTVFNIVTRSIENFDFSCFDGDAYSIVALTEPKATTDKIEDAYLYLGGITGSLVITKDMFDKIKSFNAADMGIPENEGGVVFDVVLATEKSPTVLFERNLTGIHLVKIPNNDKETESSGEC